MELLGPRRNVNEKTALSVRNALFPLTFAQFVKKIVQFVD